MQEHKLKNTEIPTVVNDGDGYVIITDENGNKIKLRKEEAALLSDGLKIIDEQRIILG